MTDLDTALQQIRARAKMYRLARAYYDGDHQLKFATDKFRGAFGPLFEAFADNLCPAVVDAVADRLTVTGFQLDGEPTARKPRVPGMAQGPAPVTAADQAWDLWQANRMDRRAGEVHAEAVRSGDGYVIVWPDASGQPCFYPKRAAMCTVQYDPEQRGAVQWAAQVWIAPDQYGRVTLYYPDRIEKYVTPSKVQGALPEDGRGLVPYQVPGEAWPLPNPYDRVPLFHFVNNAGVGEWGRSDLADVIPLQDALNKAVMDMLVAMEFTAFPQRWITGLEVETDELTGKPLAPFIPGEDRIWTVGDKEVKFGEFAAAGLDNYLAVQDSLRMEIARVSGTPVHYLLQMPGHWPSGEALRIAEVRLTHKIQDRQLSFGETWGEAVSFALQIAGMAGAVTPDWADPQPRSELEHAQELQLQQSMGIPEPVLWKDLGYTDEEIAVMQQQKAQAAQAMAATMAQAGPPQGANGKGPQQGGRTNVT
jgi:hypothetical protein